MINDDVICKIKDITKTEAIFDDDKSILLKEKLKSSVAGIYYINEVIFYDDTKKQYLYNNINDRDNDYNKVIEWFNKLKRIKDNSKNNKELYEDFIKKMPTENTEDYNDILKVINENIDKL